ncbi:hypothetical protein [Endozoicomonas sp. ISHI1]|uniref:hypothetical protein n=1 Tax=Endozoicomonas sp. ISHI1 TaxID=2825882 RepID=UPI002148543C|nr:hypothetical protein [Endozoicomonas sp. ISHI1]
MKVEGQPTGRLHPETNNFQQPVRGHFQSRNVELMPSLGSLLYQLAEFFEDVAMEFKPVSDYLCQVLTLKNFMRSASDLRYEANQASIDFKRKKTDSRSERVKLTVRKEVNELKHGLKNGLLDIREELKAALKKLTK